MPLIDVKEAVAVAKQYSADLLGVHPNETLLEEVELDEPSMLWRVTVSIPSRQRAYPPKMGDLAAVLGAGVILREYKIIEIDASAGRVRSMKIRKPNA